jgi:phytoene desaturase
MFDRYATYNGSNPYRAPATLNVIAHLENNLGAFFPKQGMYSLIQGIVKLAENRGVKFKFNTLINRILIEKNRAIGIEAEGNTLYFDTIVANSDVSYMAKYMMKHPFNRRFKKLEPSSSALVFYWGINRVTDELDFHNILFSENYREEFNKLFVEKTIYSDPTIYIFISSKIVTKDAPRDCENWFVMINAPSDANQNWDKLVKQARENIIKKINQTLHIDIEDFIEYERNATPLSIQNTTLSHAGALYGNSSNSIFSAFLRHPNFLSNIKNLYFVGGSVHPGGGIPLCLASAKIVDNEIPEV